MSDLVKYIILGIIQGLTEPIPVSSSGHIEIAKELFGWNEIGLSFSVLTNFASMIVIVIFFRHKLISLFVGFFGYIFKRDTKYKDDFKYAMKVIYATIPLGIIGVILVVTGLDEYLTNNILIVGLGLFITSILLYVASKVDATKSAQDMTVLDSFIIGCFQALAVVPGLSRSGTSLVGALSTKLNKKDAFEFVFIMYIPASIAALLPEIKDVTEDPNFSSLMLPYIGAIIATMIFTYISLLIFRKLIVADRLIYFSIYLAIVALLIFTSLIV